MTDETLEPSRLAAEHVQDGRAEDARAGGWGHMMKYAFIALAIGLIIHRIGFMWIFGLVRFFFWLGFIGTECLEWAVRHLAHVF